MQKITPFLWFDDQAEEAAKFYVSVFKDSRILGDSRYGEEGQEITGQKPGTVMVVDFEIEGQRFAALNGGPLFKFNESISFVVGCKTQEEIDYYWEKLSAVPASEQCGWLKDKFGVSWQIVPAEMDKMMREGSKEQVARLTRAFLKMKKFDLKELKKAYEG
jgi:predicted 3-demethylubiquinone-9 3-methyltransferase (glyoxalase superfamily)